MDEGAKKGLAVFGGVIGGGFALVLVLIGLFCCICLCCGLYVPMFMTSESTTYIVDSDNN